MNETKFPPIPGYEHVELLAYACGGRAACSSLYLARHIESDTRAVLTIANLPGPDSYPGRITPAARELRHPNILRVLGAGEVEGCYYEAVEAVEGGKSLAEIVREGPLSMLQIRSIALSLTRAIQYASDRSMFHLRLTPKLILLSKERVLKLSPSDFAVAEDFRWHDGLTEFAYIPPEVVMDGTFREPSPTADVYRVGAVLYEMLAGRAPFVGRSMIEVIYQVGHKLPPLPSELNASVAADLEEVCMKSLEKEPRRRHATLQSLADALVREG